MPSSDVMRTLAFSPSRVSDIVKRPSPCLNDSPATLCNSRSEIVDPEMVFLRSDLLSSASADFPDRLDDCDPFAGFDSDFSFAPLESERVRIPIASQAKARVCTSARTSITFLPELPPVAAPFPGSDVSTACSSRSIACGPAANQIDLSAVATYTAPSAPNSSGASSCNRALSSLCTSTPWIACCTLSRCLNFRKTSRYLSPWGTRAAYRLVNLPLLPLQIRTAPLKVPIPTISVATS